MYMYSPEFPGPRSALLYRFVLGGKRDRSAGLNMRREKINREGSVQVHIGLTSVTRPTVAPARGPQTMPGV